MFRLNKMKENIITIIYNLEGSSMSAKNSICSIQFIIYLFLFLCSVNLFQVNDFRRSVNMYIFALDFSLKSTPICRNEKSEY